jgi:hypothetical protein
MRCIVDVHMPTKGVSLTSRETGKQPESGKFVLSLKGPGVEIVRDVSSDQALAIIQVSMRQPRSVGSDAVAEPAVSAGTTDVQPSAGEFSLGEYLHSVGAKKNPQRILAIAAYLRDLGQDRVSKAEIKSRFPEAGEKVPGNYPRDFTNAIKNRWLAQAPDKKDSYYVTRTGDTALKNAFGSGGVGSAAARGARKQKGKGE